MLFIHLQHRGLINSSHVRKKPAANASISHHSHHCLQYAAPFSLRCIPWF
jgi:hypothetical protein